MTKCLVCGKENANVVCDNCKEMISLESLCYDITQYRVGSEENPLWEKLAKSLDNPYHFKNVALVVADEIPSPRREYVKILCLAGENSYLPKAHRPWLYEVSEQIFSCNDVSDDEKNRIRGLALSAYISDYQYVESENLANELLRYETLPKWCYYILIDFYTKTRRYDKAEKLIQRATELYADDICVSQNLNKLSEENEKKRTAAINGKKEYEPKLEGRVPYMAFMKTLGMDVEMALEKKEKRTPIPDDQYPQPVEIREADFDTFVAVDLETTGRNPKVDEIIEIGAIKVVNGEIKEEKEFLFQKFVKPYKKTISQDVTDLTGITSEDVKTARMMWDVIPEFLEFVGDNILVGYNSIKFDSKFLRRAGRYSHVDIANKHFDVWKYAKQHRGEIDVEHFTLSDVAASLGIEYPNAHRALADAITTAKVFLKLKTMAKEDSDHSLDDIFDDVDNW